MYREAFSATCSPSEVTASTATKMRLAVMEACSSTWMVKDALRMSPLLIWK